jgi:NAD(P)-dependent dehydrogenase (short-subunit alcohol dehydrogenase family)
LRGVANAVKTVGRDKETARSSATRSTSSSSQSKINLIGTFRVLAASAAGMVPLDPLRGRRARLIINTASVAAQDGQIGQAAYAASKAGVLGMALPIARDLMTRASGSTHPSRRVQDADGGDDADNVQEALAAQVPFPKRWDNRRICASRRVHGGEQLPQRRICAARRRDQDGAKVAEPRFACHRRRSTVFRDRNFTVLSRCGT